jgi:tRNA threonylcarbamoyladenosine biosynthesis protein TsaE
MTKISEWHADLASEAATVEAAAKLAIAVARAAESAAGLPMVIYLRGELGAGKTTFVRALLRALGFVGPVKSPTYTLVEVYAVSRLNLYHFDFYRLKDPNEWHEAGFRDSVSAQAISLIEWPEKALGASVALPPPDLEIHLRHQANSEHSRQLQLCAHTALGESLIKTFLTPI